MEITTLRDLIEKGVARIVQDGIVVKVHTSMIIQGEDRLSYTTIIRLTECCREAHWAKDVIEAQQNIEIDSICTALSSEFKKPTLVGTEIEISYKVERVTEKGYGLFFQIRDTSTQYINAELRIDSVFYDPKLRKVRRTPKPILDHLNKLSCHKVSKED